MRYFPFFLLLFFLSACSAEGQTLSAGQSTSAEMPPKPGADLNRLREIASEAEKFCRNRNFNLEFCLLIDMGVHSGLNRFFVWSFSADSALYSWPVGHGCCDNTWEKDESRDNPEFSNTDGSHCSSLGRYMVGERGYSNWGIHVKYMLHGLESTNSNAASRYIVLHSWEQMPSAEVYPAGSPEGWGCPTLSDSNMLLLDPLLKKSQLPALLWIFR